MDRPTQQAVPDDARIDIQEDYELHYWTARLGCTSRQLREAITAVGHEAKDVVAYLRAQTEG